MVSKNRLFIMLSLLSGFGLISSTETDSEAEESRWIPKSPITWGATAINTNLLQPLAQANAGTQLAFTAGALTYWIIYRWYWLKRPSWASLIPDGIRRFANSIFEGLGFGPGKNNPLYQEQEEQRKRESGDFRKYFGRYPANNQNQPLQYNQQYHQQPPQNQQVQQNIYVNPHHNQN